MTSATDLLTKKDVEEDYGIPVSTLSYLRHTRRGPRSGLVAGRVLYRRGDVERWIDEQFENDPTNTAA